MKKRIFVFIAIMIMLIPSNLALCESIATTFNGKAITFDKSDNIEVVSNEINIDTTTSKVNNIIYLSNTSNSETTNTFKVPLEDNELGTKVHNVIIQVNGVEVPYQKNKDGEYVFRSKIPGNTGKKIEINYETDNDLLDAKVIKYNLDYLKGKTVGKVKVNIKIRPIDVPLVKKIYPGHYTFNDNTISVEYYNLQVNNITKDIIVTKDTINGLKYNREVETNETELKVLDNMENWENNGIDIDYSKYTHKEYSLVSFNCNKYVKDLVNGESASEYSIALDNCLDVYDSILSYYTMRQFINDEKEIFYKDRFFSYLIQKNVERPLLLNELEKIYPDKDTVLPLYGKTVCIDYEETEGDLELYVYKNMDGEENDEDKTPNFQYAKEAEMDILKTPGPGTEDSGTYGARVISVGDDIDGNTLNASEEEKIQYVNMINADLYVRVMIYDNKIDTSDNLYGLGKFGYYNDKDIELAKQYGISDNNYLSEDIDKLRSKNVLKLNNDNVVNECKVPTVAQFRGYRYKENDKYIVKFFGLGYYRGYGTGLESTKKVLENSRAKELTQCNKDNNDKIKNEVEDKIKNLTISNNEKEIQDSFIIPISTIAETTDNQINFKYYVYGGIGLGIIICILILIIGKVRRNKKIKGEKTNE